MEKSNQQILFFCVAQYTVGLEAHEDKKCGQNVAELCLIY